MDDGLAELLGVEHARQTARLLVDRHAVDLRERGRGVVELVESWIDREADLATAWNPALSEAFYTIGNEDAGMVALRSAALAVHLSARGVPGEWTLTRLAPARFRWDGWLLPEADRVHVISDGATAKVVSSLGDTQLETNLVRDGDGWQADGAEQLLRFGEPGSRITLLPRHALSPEELGERSVDAVQEITPPMAAVWQSVLELLYRHAPVYLPWVRRLTRYVCPNEYPTLNSSSSGMHVGLIHAVMRTDPMPLAELLVHESAHQHFHLLTRMGPVDDGSDTNLYYSPVVRNTRRLNMILLAYHAFANILLLYRLCRASGVADGGYCDKYEPRVVEQLTELEEPLRDNPALTPLGRSLFLPLSERIHG